MYPAPNQTDEEQAQAQEYEGQAKRLENFRVRLQQTQRPPSHSPTQQLAKQLSSAQTLNPQYQQQSAFPPPQTDQENSNQRAQQQIRHQTRSRTQALIASKEYFSPPSMASLTASSISPIQYNGPDQGRSRPAPGKQENDPMIYPGLYSPSGFDMLSILIRVHQRPNPTFDLGFIDSSCALLLCSLTVPDNPIIYVSDAFTTLTGYTAPEILGKNCRFLQYPPSSPMHPFASSILHGSLSNEMKKAEFYKYHDQEDREEIVRLRESIRHKKEGRTVLRNYKKDGAGFANCLTTVPISWGENGAGEMSYIVGFQADGGNALGSVTV